MNKLGMNWFTEGRVDFEYKKYVLLAYLQQVHQSFEENKYRTSKIEINTHKKFLIMLFQMDLEPLLELNDARLSNEEP